jgi:thiol-disulfide isomerase/thioredoxin
MAAMFTSHPLTALDRAPVWLNSPPLTAEALRGRVVLVDFWTYSCINWLRTLPYVRAWHERYRDRGLTLIGAHAPEFGFEHEIDNVHRAAHDLEVGHPVVIDNDFSIWRAFDNQYWPALYLLDGGGRVRFQHFGEGAYEQSEEAIQQLLGVDEPPVAVDAGGLALAADWDRLRSPETYLGRARGERPRDDPDPGALGLNQWTLDGPWTVGAEAAVLDAAPGAIAFRFQARDLNLVLAPEPAGGPVGFTVRLDGEPPGEDHGLDVDPAGEGTLAEPRMYQLVRRRAGAGPGTFAITFHGAGVRAYVFTFG